MLANGAKLGYSTTAPGQSTTYTDLPGLKSIPDLGMDPEKVDNTVLTDALKHYEMGIGDPGDMTYKFKFENTATSAYRLLKALNGALTYWQEETADGTKTAFSGYPSIKRLGGDVNGVIDFELSIALASDLTVTNPV